MYKRKLERSTIQYCGELRTRHKTQLSCRFVKGKKISIWDLPCVAVSCTSSTCSGTTIFQDHSKSVNRHPYTGWILKSLSSLGNIGGKNSSCPYIIGQCAEPHAAQKCINKYQATSSSQIWFSKALVVRTQEIKEYCGNCTAIFQNL